jgi:F0F1-type ATP synthase assembly protein I
MALGAKPKSGTEAEEIRLGWRMAGLAFTMSSEVAAGALVGWAIDHFFGTPGSDRWLLIGSIAGICVGMLSFIRGGLALNKLLQQQEQKKRVHHGEHGEHGDGKSKK